jgi:hypothetical protein
MEHMQTDAVARVYEDALAELLTLARATLNDPTFGNDVPALAAMTRIPGISVQLESELLHFARAVVKRRTPRAG